MNELPDPEAALETLSAARSPYLIGVRHHSPALASAVPRLLDDLGPDAVLIELPSDLDDWLPWLGHPETVAPVALSVADKTGALLSFLPFADFSPELAAIRWAVAHDVPVHAIDLPSGHHEAESGGSEQGTIGAALLRTTGIATSEELWDRLVEARSYGSAPERIRRAALAIGWAWRVDAEHGPRNVTVGRSELVREAWMRKRIKEIGAERPAAVIGAFHAPALVDLELPDKAPRSKAVPVVSALVPYDFGLLDSRSGYPSGIRDPEWQQAVYEASGEPGAIDHAAAHLITRLCARLRKDGHVAGIPDSRAAYRIAADLAVLRGLPAPGRRELVEALRTALGQGEEFGRSRAVARAAQYALVGNRQGRLAKAAPRAGLVQHVEALLAELRLPRRGDEIRLDPFTSPLDRRRHVMLSRLRAARVEFARERLLEGLAGAPSLGRAWWLSWTPSTAATLELAGRYGSTLRVAAEGALRETVRLNEPAALPGLLATAAECGLVELTAELGDRLRRDFVAVAGFGELVGAYDLIERVAAGNVPGIEPGQVELAGALAALAAAAVGAVGGIAGSQDAGDARAVLALVQLVQRQRDKLGEERLRWELDRLRSTGGPLAEAAAASALVLLGSGDQRELSDRLVGWVDGEPSKLAARLSGALTVAAPLLEASSDLIDPLVDRVTAWPDDDFLTRLPDLRHGFEALATADRARLLTEIAQRFGGEAAPLAYPPESLALWASADLAGRAAVDALELP
ncbi:DUF5682 family protein [Flindersiella endophytica]